MEMKKKHLRRITFYGYLDVCIQRHIEKIGQIDEHTVVDLPNRNPEQVATALWGDIICRMYSNYINN